MPDIDNGQYFLTVLAPVDNRRALDTSGMTTSPVHALREALERMPTAMQTPAAVASGRNAPFARSTRIHFARFFIIDDVNFNGRPAADSIIATAAKTNVLVPGAVDQLSTPYLAFVLDFDPDAHADEPRTFLESLWADTPELKEIFRHCWNFDPACRPNEFADYILKCRVETTMPFHDYWTGAPGVTSMPAWWAAVPIVAALAAALALGALFRAPWYLVALMFIALALVGEVMLINWRGAFPFPAAPGATLPEVLKALYLQRRMAAFVTEHQRDAPAALHAAFGGFIKDHAPLDVGAPTQLPGVVPTPPGARAAAPPVYIPPSKVTQ